MQWGESGLHAPALLALVAQPGLPFLQTVHTGQDLLLQVVDFVLKKILQAVRLDGVVIPAELLWNINVNICLWEKCFIWVYIKKKKEKNANIIRKAHWCSEISSKYISCKQNDWSQIWSINLNGLSYTNKSNFKGSRLCGNNCTLCIMHFFS